MTLIGLFLVLSSKVNAQWTVFDPSNLAQSIANTTKNVVHTSKTATNMVRNCAPV